MIPVEHHGVFDRGPHARLARVLRLTPARQQAVRQASRVLLVSWVPLALLSAAHGAVGGPGIGVFLSDVAAQARALAAPLLVIASAFGAPRLSEIVAHFVESGIVPEQDRPRYLAAARSTRRLLESSVVEVVLVVLAYALVALLFASAKPQAHAPWARTLFDDELTWTPAGYWNALVSIPLLLVLLLGWLWRLVLWIRLLWIVAHLDLGLVASHPDRAAGLGFAGQSVRAFIPVAMAISLLVAGAVVREQPMHALSSWQLGLVVVGTAAVQVVLFCGPLTTFLVPILAARRRGIFAYGDLARRVGLTFERSWIESPSSEARVLDDAASSPTADLYDVVANVYAIRPAPVEGEDLLLLLAATLLPFVPVLLMTMPVSSLLGKLTRMLL